MVPFPLDRHSLFRAMSFFLLQKCSCFFLFFCCLFPHSPSPSSPSGPARERFFFFPKDSFLKSSSWFPPVPPKLHPFPFPSSAVPIRSPLSPARVFFFQEPKGLPLRVLCSARPAFLNSFLRSLKNLRRSSSFEYAKIDSLLSLSTALFPLILPCNFVTRLSSPP